MKKFIGAILFSLIASVALSDTLFWQVGSNKSLTDALGDQTYVSAAVKVSNDRGATTTLLDNYTEPGSGPYSVVGAGSATSGVYADLAGYIGGTSSPAYQFVIELYNESGDAVANTGWTDFSAAKTYIAKSEFNSNWQTMTAGYQAAQWHAGAAAPEPTSGLLFLVGAALVGLRRRKVVA